MDPSYVYPKPFFLSFFTFIFLLALLGKMPHNKIIVKLVLFFSLM